MLYICIPVHNEAPTAGLVLWRLRKVLQEFPREYEVVVFDDGSTDATREAIEPYTEVLPLTIIGSDEHVGYARALDALLRDTAARTRYPRRDAVITLQGDFTDQPEHLPELIKRFEGGADVVVAERPVPPKVAPKPIRWMRRLSRWVSRPFVRVAGVNDPFGTYRLYRVSIIRDLIKAAGNEPIAEGATATEANLDLLLRVNAVARRVETIPAEPRYDLRPRESRIDPWPHAMSLLRHSRAVRGRYVPAEQ